MYKYVCVCLSVCVCVCVCVCVYVILVSSSYRDRFVPITVVPPMRHPVTPLPLPAPVVRIRPPLGRPRFGRVQRHALGRV